jgi:hypothetical protein
MYSGIGKVSCACLSTNLWCRHRLKDLDIGGDMVAFAMGLKIDSSCNRMHWWSSLLYVKRPSCETLRSTEEDPCNGISATLSQISSVALVWRTRGLIPALT